MFCVACEADFQVIISELEVLTYSQLFLCAGINANKYGIDYDDIESIFAVNWLGNFYVANLLYPLLRETSKMKPPTAPRIILEVSELHRSAPSNVRFETIEEINDSGLSPVEFYGRSKLAMILGAKYGLYERVIKPNKDNIYVVCVHPGAVCNFFFSISCLVSPDMWVVDS
jgi:NAD(P)-dependent dehydrogenase (short-subunit alcohol dehydrogenase family)